MQVYAFIGKTGTGKSYRAQMVAQRYQIRYIIDDAILIKDGKLIEGKSAKTEATKLASVKAAIFLDPLRKARMADKIKKESPDKILILGTSDEMVEKIVEALGLGSIYKRIYIEDVATKEEIEMARKSRIEEGKHVVPVPTFEIREQFSGYFLDPLKIFNIFSKNEKPEMAEKTIIRPTFSYLGNYVIDEKAINSIVYYVVGKIKGINKVLLVDTRKYIDGMKLDIDIEIKYGTNIPKLSHIIKNSVIYTLENMTGINIFGININVKSVSK